MKTYLNELESILLHGHDHEDRTGVGRRSLYGKQFRFDLTEGFPLVTTKKVSIRNIIIETLWFLSGSSRALDLEEQGVNIWKQWTPTVDDADKFYQKLLDNDDLVSEIYQTHNVDDETIRQLKKDMLTRVGTIGPLYGAVWRGKYKAGTVAPPDQIKTLIANLKVRPFHSRHCVTAWIPSLLPHPKFSPSENVLLGLGALAPCHFFFQCFVKEAHKPGGKLRLSMNVNIR